MIYYLMILCAGMLALGVCFTVKEKRLCSEIHVLHSRYTAVQDTLEKICGDAQQMYELQKVQLDALAGCVEDLKNGIVPDYEKAKAAAVAVNDFHAGLAGIMGFDPLQAIKKERGKSGGQSE